MAQPPLLRQGRESSLTENLAKKTRSDILVTHEAQKNSFFFVPLVPFVVPSLPFPSRWSPFLLERSFEELRHRGDGRFPIPPEQRIVNIIGQDEFLGLDTFF